METPRLQWEPLYASTRPAPYLLPSHVSSIRPPVIQSSSNTSASTAIRWILPWTSIDISYIGTKRIIDNGQGFRLFADCDPTSSFEADIIEHTEHEEPKVHSWVFPEVVTGHSIQWQTSRTCLVPSPASQRGTRSWCRKTHAEEEFLQLCSGLDSRAEQ